MIDNIIFNALRNLLILLTGCINPNNMSFTFLQNIETRKNHYLDSIKFYLTETELPILFVENSGVDISDSFKNEIEIGRLEILTFNGNNYDKMRGKGYGEMIIIEHASLFSKLFKKAEFIFKITGRYKVLNIKSHINYYNQIDCDLFINFKPSLSFADSRFWGANSSFYTEVLINYKDIINDSNSVYFEHALCNAIHESIIKGYRYSGLYHYPRYSGIYGTDGSEYNDSWANWFPKEVLSKVLFWIQKTINVR